ncbi:MAG: protein kinase [Myxococcota bacterium]
MNEPDLNTVAELFAGRYEILGRMPWNGLALVYKARAKGKDVAVAVLPLDCEGPEERAAAFRSNASKLVTLRAPSWVPTTGFGIQHGVPYLELGIEPGRPLAEELQRDPIGKRRSHAIFLGILDALDALHQDQRCHWDLTPANVLLNGSPSKEQVRLVGVGIAELLRSARDTDKTGPTGKGSGDHASRYLAPELLAGGPLGVAADVYSAAAILFHMLTDRPPPKGGSVTEAEPVLGAYYPLVRRALQIDPRKRYRTVAELREALPDAPLSSIPARPTSRPRISAVPRPQVDPPSVLRSPAPPKAKTAHRSSASARHVPLYEPEGAVGEEDDTRRVSVPPPAKSRPPEAASQKAAASQKPAASQKTASQKTASQKTASPGTAASQKTAPPGTAASQKTASPGTAASHTDETKRRPSQTPWPEDKSPEISQANRPSRRKGVGLAVIGLIVVGGVAAAIALFLADEPVEASNEVSPDNTAAPSEASGGDPSRPDQPPPSTSETVESSETANPVAEATPPSEGTTSPEETDSPEETASEAPNPEDSEGTDLLVELPEELHDLGRRIRNEESLDRATLMPIAEYARDHRDDPRPHLLLAAAFVRRGWNTNGIERYIQAYETDPEARHHEQMQADLLLLVGGEESGLLASQAIVRIYGEEMLPNVEAALDNTPRAYVRRRLELLRDRITSAD